MAITIDGADNKLEIGANATGPSSLRLYEDTDNGTNYVSIIAPSAVTSNRTITLPDATGTLVTNSGSEAGAFSTLTVNSNNISAENSLGFRNRIINGDMRIDQRNAGAAVTGLTGGSYTVDRWTAFQNYGTVTRQQSTTAPTGFVNSFYTTVTSTASVSSSSIYSIVQSIEGTNVSDLAFGSASAKTITISFQVRSSVTGTYGIFIRNSAADRFYASTFSISSANTFEAKTITIAGDTGGTWLTTTGIGLTVGVVLGAGTTRQGTANTWTASSNGPYTTSSQVDWMSNSGATFYITGVQLEVGSVATPFERRDYGRELAMCQRYCYAFTSAGGYGSTPIVGANQTTTLARTTFSFPTTMRGSPTTTFSAANTFLVQEINGAANRTVSAVATDSTSNQNIFINFTISSGTAGASVLVYDNNANAKITVSSEL
jgi:hypothetical protein